MENNIGGQPPSSGRGRLQEVVVYRGSNSKALAGLNVCVIGGRLCEVVAFEWWLNMEVRVV